MVNNAQQVRTSGKPSELLERLSFGGLFVISHPSAVARSLSREVCMNTFRLEDDKQALHAV